MATPSPRNSKAAESEKVSAIRPTIGDSTAKSRVESMFLTDKTVALVADSIRECIEWSATTEKMPLAKL
jgi:hypothetical protein